MKNKSLYKTVFLGIILLILWVLCVTGGIYLILSAIQDSGGLKTIFDSLWYGKGA